MCCKLLCWLYSSAVFNGSCWEREKARPGCHARHLGHIQQLSSRGFPFQTPYVGKGLLPWKPWGGVSQGSQISLHGVVFSGTAGGPLVCQTVLWSVGPCNGQHYPKLSFHFNPSHATYPLAFTELSHVWIIHTISVVGGLELQYAHCHKHDELKWFLKIFYRA